MFRKDTLLSIINDKQRYLIRQFSKSMIELAIKGSTNRHCTWNLNLKPHRVVSLMYRSNRL